MIFLRILLAVAFGLMLMFMSYYAGTIVFSGFGAILGMLSLPIGLVYGYRWRDMKLAGRLIIFSLLLIEIVFAASMITIFNAAWKIGRKYPLAKLDLEKVNTAGIYSLSSTANYFGIPKTDPDHHLKVTLDSHSALIRLDDFSEANQIYIKNSKVSDISAFLKPTSNLYEAYFIGCEFDAMPQEQRSLLKPLSKKLSNSFYIPYEQKRRRG